MVSLDHISVITAFWDLVQIKIIHRILLCDLLFEHLDVVFESLECDEDYGEVVE